MDIVPFEPQMAEKLKRRWSDGRPGSRMVMRAVRGEERLGVCCMDRGQTSPHPDAADWCYCDWIGVKEEHRGKRLGMFLLVSALEEMRRAGCKHTAISTTWNNYRAAVFYTNLGYRFADQTYSFRKECGG